MDDDTASFHEEEDCSDQLRAEIEHLKNKIWNLRMEIKRKDKKLKKTQEEFERKEA